VLKFGFKIVRDLVLVLMAGLFFCFSVMFFVNHFSPPPTHGYDPNRCSRYCHDKGCRHVEQRYAGLKNSFIVKAAGTLYNGNIALLGNLPGLNYKQACILIYLIGFPLPWLFLIVLVLAQRRRIKDLQSGMK